jgi:hypothetical protein
LTADERQDLDLRVYIANSDPSDHPIHSSPVLSHADAVVSVRDVKSKFTAEMLRELELKKKFKEKIPIDFALALQHCYENSTAPYIGLFEDDIVAANSWFIRTQFALRDVETASHDRPWLDLRLFNDANEIRWSAQKFGSTNVPFTTLGVPLVIATLSGTLYSVVSVWLKRKGSFTHRSQQALIAVCVVTIPVAVVMFIKAGRFSMIARADGVSVQPWGCCTQGEIFHRDSVPGLIQALLDKREQSPADIIVWDHATEANLLRYVLDPPMVQHLGSLLSSSLTVPDRGKQKPSWSIAFEDLDEGTLLMEHARMVRELYGIP